jgi:hypothetical protein
MTTNQNTVCHSEQSYLTPCISGSHGKRTKSTGIVRAQHVESFGVPEFFKQVLSFGIPEENGSEHCLHYFRVC